MCPPQSHPPSGLVWRPPASHPPSGPVRRVSGGGDLDLGLAPVGGGGGFGHPPSIAPAAARAFTIECLCARAARGLGASEVDVELLSEARHADSLHLPGDLGALAPDGQLGTIARQVLLARIGAQGSALLQAAVDASRALLLPMIARRSFQPLVLPTAVPIRPDPPQVFVAPHVEGQGKVQEHAFGKNGGRCRSQAREAGPGIRRRGATDSDHRDRDPEGQRDQGN